VDGVWEARAEDWEVSSPRTGGGPGNPGRGGETAENEDEEYLRNRDRGKRVWRKGLGIE